jgi:hypothetical protein
MPFPDAAAYYPSTQAGQTSLQGSQSTDPRWRWDPVTQSFQFYPESGTWDETYGSGGSSIPAYDPSRGTNVVIDGQTQNFAEGVTPYSFLSAGSNYPGGIATVAQGSPEYHALRDDARTRNQQGIARVGALVGGAAALGGATAGSGSGTATVSGSNTAAGMAGSVGPNGLPTGAMSASGGGLGAMTGGVPAVGASGAALTGVAGGSWLDRFLPYAASGASSLLGAYGANQAADAEEAALQRAIDEQRRQYDTTRSDLMPWMEAGRGALGNLQNAGTAFQTSPGYQWRLNEGQRDIGNSFSARGGAASGNALRALSEYNQGLAGGEFNNWWNQQAGLAGVGQNTAVTLGGVGQNTAGNVSAALAGQGVSRASGIANRYGSLGQGLNDSLNWLWRKRAGYV